MMTPRTRPLIALLAALLAALTIGGCAMAPDSGEPLRPAELETLVSELTLALSGEGSYRGTGKGEITVSGRTLKVAFAVVYERPGWLRADLRPELGTLGASLTALGTMENGCARMFFPARLLVVTGCVSDVAGDVAELDPAALVLGLPDPSLLSRLEGVSSSRRGERVRIAGHYGGANVVVEVNESLPAITAIEIARDDSDDRMRLTYGGHGWKSAAPVPRTVEMTALEGTSRELGMSVRYETLKPAGPVDRAEYEPVVPDGVLEIDWKELNIWR